MGFESYFTVVMSSLNLRCSTAMVLMEKNPLLQQGILMVRMACYV